MSRTFLLSLLFVANTLLLAIAPAHADGKRVALIIGNASYSDVGELANPIIDAKAVTEAFENAGFDQVRHVNDLSADAMRQELKSFSALSDDAEIAVIYYAGHGVEVNDQNYLVPVDAKLARSSDIDFEAISLASVRSAVSGASKLRMVVLDACRNNPFKLVGNKGTRAATRGLANIEPDSGEIVAYSAKEGTLAQDGPANSNSPFAAALVKSLNEPGLEIRLLFGRVRDEVRAATDNEQEPYSYISLGGDPVYLKPPVELNANPGPALPKSFRDCPDCPEMVLVPAGEFLMGSPDDEKGRDKDEGPQHQVTLKNSFAVGKFEVTRAEYEQFVTATGHKVGNACAIWDGKKYVNQLGQHALEPGMSQTPQDPVTCVSWDDAKAYVAWLSEHSGYSYRLLTEAEWEYAARAGSTDPYVTGQILDANQVNFKGKSTLPVGKFPANAFGLHDIQGNVWEWTEDCHAPDYSNASSDGRAIDFEDCERTYRGGAWSNTAKDLRFATRGTNAPHKRVNIFGMRVARDVK